MPPAIVFTACLQDDFFQPTIAKISGKNRFHPADCNTRAGVWNSNAANTRGLPTERRLAKRKFNGATLHRKQRREYANDFFSDNFESGSKRLDRRGGISVSGESKPLLAGHSFGLCHQLFFPTSPPSMRYKKKLTGC